MYKKLKSYFDKELITAIVFGLVGAVVGYVSFTINNSIISLVAMIVVGGVLYAAFKTAAKIQHDRKWWLSNAFIVYVLLWLVSWTVYYNLALK